MKKIFVLFLLSLLFLTGVYGLAISGNRLVIKQDFSPGAQTYDSFIVKNAEGYVSDYFITTQYMKGQNLSPFLHITPTYIEGIESGESAGFSVRMILPDEMDVAGESETWVVARIDTSRSGGIRAVPSVGARYIIFVLYPYPYVEYEYHIPNLNINESIRTYFEMENLGEPTINSVYGEVDIYSLETGDQITTIRTTRKSVFEPWEEIQLVGEYDSTGLPQGDYNSEYRLYWGDNVSEGSQEFKIGNERVEILNFTDLFEYDAINKFDIEIESKWNTKIEDIYADVTIISPSGVELRKFKSVNTDLIQWEVKTLEAYFDARGLEKGEYKASVALRYGDKSNSLVKDITIDENIGAEVVEEIPGRFKLSSLGKYASTQNILYALIVVFIILNLFLVTGYFRSKKPKEDVEVDPSVVKKIKEMRKQYKDEYIEEMMLKKGWSKEKVRHILKEAKK